MLESSKVLPNRRLRVEIRGRGFIIIGHRGCNGPTSQYSSDGRDVPPHLLPENTLQALAEGMFGPSPDFIAMHDGIEFDVYNTREEVEERRAAIPVVCHDDALNKNAAGVKRDGNELGYISQSNLSQVFSHNVGQGKIIPPLEAVLISIGVNNALRKAQGLPNIVFNIELKGKGTAQSVHRIVQKVITQHGRIAPDDIVYCSSKLEELEQMRELDENAQIAYAVNTEDFFGKENVLDGFVVPMGLAYKKELFPRLDSIWQKIKFNAIDCTFWDINSQLIDYAKTRGFAIHTTLANFMDFNVVLIDHLLSLHNQLGYDHNSRSKLFFKTDCPKFVKEMMQDRLGQPQHSGMVHDMPRSLDSCEPVPVSTEEIVIIAGRRSGLGRARPYMGEPDSRGRWPKPDQTPELEKQLTIKKQLNSMIQNSGTVFATSNLSMPNLESYTSHITPVPPIGEHAGAERLLCPPLLASQMPLGRSVIDSSNRRPDLQSVERVKPRHGSLSNPLPSLASFSPDVMPAPSSLEHFDSRGSSGSPLSASQMPSGRSEIDSSNRRPDLQSVERVKPSHGSLSNPLPSLVPFSPDVMPAPSSLEHFDSRSPSGSPLSASQMPSGRSVIDSSNRRPDLQAVERVRSRQGSLSNPLPSLASFSPDVMPAPSSLEHFDSRSPSGSPLSASQMPSGRSVIDSSNRRPDLQAVERVRSRQGSLSNPLPSLVPFSPDVMPAPSSLEHFDSRSPSSSPLSASQMLSVSVISGENSRLSKFSFSPKSVAASCTGQSESPRSIANITSYPHEAMTRTLFQAGRGSPFQAERGSIVGFPSSLLNTSPAASSSSINSWNSFATSCGSGTNIAELSSFLDVAVPITPYYGTSSGTGCSSSPMSPVSRSLSFGSANSQNPFSFANNDKSHPPSPLPSPLSSPQQSFHSASGSPLSSTSSSKLLSATNDYRHQNPARYKAELSERDLSSSKKRSYANVNPDAIWRVKSPTRFVFDFGEPLSNAPNTMPFPSRSAMPFPSGESGAAPLRVIKSPYPKPTDVGALLRPKLGSEVTTNADMGSQTMAHVPREVWGTLHTIPPFSESATTPRSAERVLTPNLTNNLLACTAAVSVLATEVTVNPSALSRLARGQSSCNADSMSRAD